MEDWEIVETAADIMEERGHCKGVLEDGQGRVCIDGALAIALGLDQIYEMDTFAGSQKIYENGAMLRITRRIVNIVEPLDNDPRSAMRSAMHSAMSPSCRLFGWNDRVHDVSDQDQYIIDETRRAAKVIRMEDEG